jgi:sulfate adenylyltransferase
MKYRQLHIDKEAVATLGLLQDGLLYPVTKLMNKQEAKIVDETKKYNNITFPFSFILAPNGKRNEEVLSTIKNNETLDLVCDNKICGKITSKEVFKIDKQERIKIIFGTQNLEHSGVRDTNRRLGNYAICGDFEINFKETKKYKNKIAQAIKTTRAKKISSMMVSGKPFHRAHEQLIRTALTNCDLLVLFILKPYKDELLSYETRKKTIEYFCNNYLPKDKVIVIPLENTYIFGGFNELVLNAIVAKNFGCDKLIVGENQTGLGAFYCKGNLSSVADNIKDIKIKIKIMSAFVYCDQCGTLVNQSTCPHGHHHHINYHSASILGLLELGIIPPSILMRKEISSIILSDLFPQRQAKLNQIQQHLSSNSSLLDDFDAKNFYESLINLHQISSLT